MSLGCASPRSGILFSFSALTLLVGRQEQHVSCKDLGVGMLIVMIWPELTAPVVTARSIFLSSSIILQYDVLHQLTQVVLKNGC